ncbi:MAG TPA: response regulator [Polyangiaceae bacterium]|nr:response regulator [Polyangiaceae bacterium]
MTEPFRVLLIDDSPPLRRLVAGALEASGLAVVEASEGYEALWKVRAEGVFDLIIADIHLPNVDGLTFIREVRQLHGYAEVPIFVLTSDGSRELRQDGRLAGATAWLLKPPDLPALVHSVHAALLQLIKVTDPNGPKSAPQSVPPGSQPSSRIPRSTRSLEAHPSQRSSRAPAPSRRSKAPDGGNES